MNINTLQTIVKILIVIVTIYLSYQLALQINLNRAKDLIKNRYIKMNESYLEKRLQRYAKKYTRTISFDMSLADHIEIYLIDKSNIRKWIPFMNFYVFVFCSLLIFIGIFILAYRILWFVPSSFFIALVFLFSPALFLDIMSKYNSEKIRRRLGYFVSVLARWIDVKADIIYAFEKSVDSGVEEPLRTFINDMVIQVRKGMDPLDALTILNMKIDNSQFSDFILNIKQNIKYRGNLKTLLVNMETQFYKLEEEMNRRKISTYRDRLYIVFAMILVILIGYVLLATNPKAYTFYLHTMQGKWLLTLFTFLYAAGFYVMTTISKFEH